MSDTNWRNLIIQALMPGDSFEDLAIAIDDGELDRIFDNGLGLIEGSPFTAWSRQWVYFPVVYDGSEWVGCVPRNPCAIQTKHQGDE